MQNMLHFRLILVAITLAVSTTLSGQPHGETTKFPDFLRITPDKQKQTTIVLYNYSASLGLFEFHEFKPPHNTIFSDNTFYILKTLEEPHCVKKWEYFRTGPSSWSMIATDSLGTTFRQVRVIDEVIHSDTLDYCRAYGDGFELISQILVYSKTN